MTSFESKAPGVGLLSGLQLILLYERLIVFAKRIHLLPSGGTTIMRRYRLHCICSLSILILGLAAGFNLKAVNHRSGSSSTTSKSTLGASKAPVSQQSALTTSTTQIQEGEPGKGLWLTLRSTGFEPSQLTLPADRYFVVIQNATGLDSYALTVQRVGEERLFDVRGERFIRKWKKAITFQPGKYSITESDHPEWTCLITVTDR